MKQQQKIYFSLPGFYRHYQLLLDIIYLYKNVNYVFNDDIVIESVYDSFPCIWNGGRYITNSTSIANIQATIQPFIEQDIEIRYTFTNALLREEHLNDTVCNAILKESCNSNNKIGITINSPLLKKYIENKYPNQFYFNWSATKCLDNINEINELSKQDNVIPSYQDVNNNWDILNKLINRDKIEFVIDEGCIDNCPYKKIHYETFNKMQIFEAADCMECIGTGKSNNVYDNKLGTRKHHITLEQIRNEYIPKGFNHFKIAGREMPEIAVIESCIFYLIKPEYQNKIRYDLLLSTFHRDISFVAYLQQNLILE